MLVELAELQNPESRLAIIQTVLIEKTLSRIFHPTVRNFFLQFIADGTFQYELRLMTPLTPVAAEALTRTLITHVHKEKPVFLHFIGENLGLPSATMQAIAAACDVLWAISLIYDDAYDHDDVRGNIETVWKTYGKERTISACQEIFATVLRDLALVHPQVEQSAHEYVQQGLNSLAEHERVTLQADPSQLFENYHKRNDFHGVYGVRALHFMAEQPGSASETNAVLFLRNINLGSQILNDWKDVVDSYHRGYSDIRNGVVTVPLLDLFAELSPADQREFMQLFGSKKAFDTHQLSVIRQLVSRTNVDEKSRTRIEDLYRMAEQFAEQIFSQTQMEYVRSWIAYKREVGFNG